MQIANRESFAVASSRSRLPYDSRVEYLQSSGTQYIDTGYIPYGHTPVITFRLYCIGTQSNVSMFGARDPTLVSNKRPSLWLSAGSAGWAWMIGDTNYGGTNTLSELVGAWHVLTFDVRAMRLLIDGSDPGGPTYNTVMPNMHLYLFATNETSWRAPFTGRISSFKIEDERGVVMDMIPVRKGDTGYMYDRVSGRLFGNAGTGDFVLGPDKPSWTNPYVTDGLIAMWDGEWNAGGGVHDAAAATWTDLVGGVGLTLPSGWSVGATYVASGGNALTLPDSIKSALTIEAVFRLDSMGSGRSLLYFKNGAEAGWRAANEHGVSVRSNGQINFSGAGAYTTGIAASTIYSAVCTYGSATSTASAAYINGSARTLSGSGMYGLGTASKNSGISVFSSYKFLGRIYALRFCSRALTAAEIAANYAIDRERFNLP